MRFIAVTARALTLGVKNDCKSMSAKLRYWIVNIIQRDTARPLVSRLYFSKVHSRDQGRFEVVIVHQLLSACSNLRFLKIKYRHSIELFV